MEPSIAQNSSTKTVSAFEFASSFKSTIRKQCNRKLPMGKIIDEETPGVRKVSHACADEVMQEVALAVWASYGDEIEVSLNPETKKWRAVCNDINVLAKRTINKYVMREFRIQNNISFKDVGEVVEQEEYDFSDDTFFDKLDSALLVEDMLSYMPEDTAKVMVMYHDLNNSLRAISAATGLHRSTVVKRLEQGAHIAQHYMNREDEDVYKPWAEYHKKGGKAC